MTKQATTQTVQAFTAHVAGQDHAMAGAVIAASAAQAAALGRACMRISLTRWGDDLNEAEVNKHIARMDDIRLALLGWCDRDAAAIAEFVALREAGDELAGQQLLCEAPADMSRLAIEAAELLETFRPLVHEQVRDDLEMSMTLLAGTAQAAMLLLDSNLRIWPEPELLDRFEPVLAKLNRDIQDLTPVPRLRRNKDISDQ